MQKTIKIRNLDCANCAAELQEELEKIEGISEPSVDFINQRVVLNYDGDTALEKAVYCISHFEEVEIIDGNAPAKKERHLKEIISIAVSVAFFVPALILQILELNQWVVFGLYLASCLAAGWTVLVAVGGNIGKAFKGGFHFGMLVDENLLMLIASIGAFCIGETMEGAAVMLLYQIGELLQTIAVGSSRNAIEKLMELKSDCAIVLTGEEQKEVSPEDLTVGDYILIRKGDKIPVDCVLCEGTAELDTKSLTGESALREVHAGEEMLSGCVNSGSAIKAKVIRPLSESAVAKILEMVESSSAKKAKPEKFITKFARIYTPIVVLLALAVAVVPPLCLGASAAVFSIWISRALNFLVISCPCALIISVPLTYFSGVGTLARKGVLVKGAMYLDTLAKVSVAAFDKTGTLTEGKFFVSNVHGQRALELAAAVEKNSSHPLAQAFRAIPTPFVAQECEELSGLGLRATVEGKEVLVGSARLLKEHGIAFTELQSYAAVIYVAENGEFIGCVEIEDKLRSDAGDTLAKLKRCGISRLAVLTGDTKERAERVLAGLPIDELHADLLPAQKTERAKSLKAQGVMLYAGDGINDTPIMAESDIAVSMGALGSDAAIEASDLVLASDCLSALPEAIKGARKTRRIVKENIVGSIAIKVALLGLSLFGLITLWVAVLGDVGVMLLAVLNSLRMRK